MTANIERLCPGGPGSSCSQTPDGAGMALLLAVFRRTPQGGLRGAFGESLSMGTVLHRGAEGITGFAPIKDGATVPSAR